MATKTETAAPRTLADRMKARLTVPAAATGTITETSDGLRLIFPAREGMAREEYRIDGDGLKMIDPKAGK